MKKNVGTVDRVIRIAVGVALLALMFMGVISWWGWIGVVPIVTAIIGWCPAYCPLKINTAGKGSCSSNGEEKKS